MSTPDKTPTHASATRTSATHGDAARGDAAHTSPAEEGPRVGYILVALIADVAIAIAKLVVGLLTASTAMLSEAAHSFADTTNQIFLLVGIKRSSLPADEDHPFGHGKEQIFWAFLAAIFIFVSGGFFSVYEGTHRLFSEEEHKGAFWPGYVVLAASLGFGIVSLIATWKEIKALAREEHLSVARFLRDVPALTAKTTFYADIAAIIGVAVAAIGLILVETTGNPRWDGLASILIGIILVIVAIVLGVEARDVLIGSSARPETRRRIRETILSFPEVESIVTLLTMELGTDTILVTGQVDLASHLSSDEIESLLERLTTRVRAAVPSVRNIYLEPRSRQAIVPTPVPA